MVKRQTPEREVGFETYLRCVVSLSKTLSLLPKVLVIPRKLWVCSDITEKLLNGTLSLNTNKQSRIPAHICLRYANTWFVVILAGMLRNV